MRHVLSLLVLIPLAACTSTGPAPAPAPGVVPHPSECLDPERARSWSHVDDSTLLVDAGSRKYRVVLAESCFALGTSPELHFVGESISNRVCGHAGEYVVSGRQRCRIQRVERLDDAVYKQALDEADGKSRSARASAARSSGAAPTMTPVGGTIPMCPIWAGIRRTMPSVSAPRSMQQSHDRRRRMRWRSAAAYPILRASTVPTSARQRRNRWNIWN